MDENLALFMNQVKACAENAASGQDSRYRWSESVPEAWQNLDNNLRRLGKESREFEYDQDSH